MSTNTMTPALDAAIAEYLAACDAGTPPQRDEFVARFPEVGPALADFIDQHHRLRGAVQQVQNATVDFQAPNPADAPTLEPGSGRAADESLGRIRYFGDYELLQELARGGMGVVFRARQVSLHREVALKMILAGQLASPADIQRFRTEAEAAANLDHPHILPIYEVGEHQGQQYFSMKLVEGGNLSHRLGELRARPREAVALMIHLARAVHYAHQRGILHRDLKPANVLLDKAGTPYITDFGLAKRTEGGNELTHTGAILGTPSYMAPEQARAEKHLTTAVDVHALGAILYEMLTGQPPYRGTTVMETVMQVMEHDPKPPEQVAGGVDRDLAVIALKCLRKAPAERYASAAALAEDLERWQRGEPILARPVTASERAWKWVRRNPAVAGLLGVAAVLVVGILLALVGMLRQSQARALESQRRLAEEQQRLSDAQAAAARELKLKEAADQARLAAERAAARERDLRTQSEGLLHANRISLAHQYWRSDNLDRTTALLNEVPPDRRGWEWQYLQRIAHGETVQLPGNGQFTHYLNASADGRWLAAIADSGIAGVDVWDLSTNRRRAQLDSHQQRIQVQRAAISADGQTLVIGERSGEVSAWDVATQKRLRSLGKLKGGVQVLSMGPGNQVLASGGNAKRWDLATGAELALPPDIIGPLALAPDGKHLLALRRNPKFYRTSLHENLMVLHDLKSGNIVHTFGFMRAWSFTPDGSRVAVAGYDAQERAVLEVIDLATLKVVMSARHAGAFGDIAMSPDGKRVATVPFMSVPISVWDVASGRIVRRLRGHTDSLNAVLFLADGRLASCSWDCTIRLWDPQRGVEATSLPGKYADVVSHAAFRPGGNEWAVVQGDNVGGGILGRVFGGPSPGELVILADPIKGIVRHRLQGHSNGARQVAYSTDGKRLISGGRDGLAIVWDAERASKLAAMKHPGWVTHVALSPDGTLAASTHEDPKDTKARFGEGPWELIPGEVRVWEAATGQERFVLKGFPSAVGTFAFAPDGKTLVTAASEVLTFWDLATGKAITTHAIRDAYPERMTFTPDGRRLLLLESRVLRVWDVAANHMSGTFAGVRQARFNSMAVHPDGQRVALAAGGQVKVIDLQSLAELLTLNQPADTSEGHGGEDDGTRAAHSVVEVAFTADGRTLLGLTGHGTTVAWETAPAGIIVRAGE